MNYYLKAADLLEQVGFDRSAADEPVTLYKAKTGKTYHYTQTCGRLANSITVSGVAVAPAQANIEVCLSCVETAPGRAARDLYLAATALNNIHSRLNEAKAAWPFGRIKLLNAELELCEHLRQQPNYHHWADDLLRTVADINVLIAECREQCSDIRPLLLSATGHWYRLWDDSIQADIKVYGDMHRYSGPGRRIMRAAEDTFKRVLVSTGDVGRAKQLTLETLSNDAGEAPTELSQLPSETRLDRSNYDNLHEWLTAEWAAVRDDTSRRLVDQWAELVEGEVDSSLASDDVIVMVDMVSFRFANGDMYMALFNPCRVASSDRFSILRVPYGIFVFLVEAGKPRMFDAPALPSDTPETLALAAELLDIKSDGPMATLAGALSVARAIA